MEPDWNIGPKGSRNMLDKCILSYMRRRQLPTAADIFALEAGITDEHSIDDNGLLKVWWDSFYETYGSIPNYRPEELTTSPIDPQTQIPMNQRLRPETFQSSEINFDPNMIPREGPSTSFVDRSPQMPGTSACPIPTAADIFALEAGTTDEHSIDDNALLKVWWDSFDETYGSIPNYRPEELTTSPIDPQTQIPLNQQSRPETLQTSEINFDPNMIPREGPSTSFVDRSSQLRGTSACPIKIPSEPSSPERELPPNVTTDHLGRIRIPRT